MVDRKLFCYSIKFEIIFLINYFLMQSIWFIWMLILYTKVEWYLCIHRHNASNWLHNYTIFNDPFYNSSIPYNEKSINAVNALLAFSAKSGRRNTNSLQFDAQNSKFWEEIRDCLQFGINTVFIHTGLQSSWYHSCRYYTEVFSQGHQKHALSRSLQCDSYPFPWHVESPSLARHMMMFST